MTHSHPDACSLCLNRTPRGPQETGTVQLPVNHGDNVHMGHTDIMVQRVRKKKQQLYFTHFQQIKRPGGVSFFKKGKSPHVVSSISVFGRGTVSDRRWCVMRSLSGYLHFTAM